MMVLLALRPAARLDVLLFAIPTIYKCLSFVSECLVLMLHSSTAYGLQVLKLHPYCLCSIVRLLMLLTYCLCCAILAISLRVCFFLRIPSGKVSVFTPK